MSTSYVVLILALVTVSQRALADPVPEAIEAMVERESQRIGQKVDDVSTLVDVRLEDKRVVFVYDNPAGALPPKPVRTQFSAWLKSQLCSAKNQREQSVIEAMKINDIAFKTIYLEEGEYSFDVVSKCSE